MRHFITLLVCFMQVIGVQAQSNRLDYYKHTKTVWANGRAEIQSGDKGQFVNRTTRNGVARCYDATSSGLDHLNGVLCYIGNKGSIEVYQGNSYWGDNTYYQFDDQRGYLNVKDNSGNVYVFQRFTAPAGRKRSSYLSQRASADGWDAEAEWNRIQHPEINSGGSTGGSNSSDSKPGRRTTPTKNNSSRSCGYCNGSGRVRAHIGVSGYGVDNKKKKCSTCGVWYYTSEDHWHACPYCRK